jgi:Flp pilus assembly pilin Flp
VIDVKGLLSRLVVDDRGQDLVEYALLVSIIGIAGVLVFPEIEEAIGAAFDTWTGGAYDDWCPDDPGGGAACSEE